jgi:type III secretion protein Q
VTIDDDVYQLQLLPDFTLSNWQPAVVLRITFGQHTGWLLCSDFPLSERWRNYCQAVELAELPDELRTMIAEAALAPVLEMGERGLGVPIHIVEWPTHHISVPKLITIGFALRDRLGNQVTGALLGEETLRSLALQALESWPLPPQEHWDKLLIRLPCEVGDTRLTVLELAQLSLGDVLLLAHCRYLKDRSVTVRTTSHSALHTRFYSGKWIIEPFPQETPLVEQNIPLVDTDELTVPLTFTIGEMAISLGELRQLQPGYAFELERGLERLVTIHSNGQRLGVGELIKIDGRAGVRIVELVGRFPDG